MRGDGVRVAQRAALAVCDVLPTLCPRFVLPGCVCGVRCTVCGVRCAMCGVRCAVRGVRCAVRGEPDEPHELRVVLRLEIEPPLDGDLGAGRRGEARARAREGKPERGQARVVGKGSRDLGAGKRGQTLSAGRRGETPERGRGQERGDR
eukprot:4023202-Prymnesium_polylepis.1